jgi:hypothetical protein
MLLSKLKRTKAVRQVHQRSRATQVRQANALLRVEGHSSALEERTTKRCVMVIARDVRAWSPFNDTI